MSMQDPIADLLTRIRNGLSVRLSEVKVPASNIKRAILKVLQEEGYILGFDEITVDNHPWLQVHLKYYQGSPVIETIKRVSRPGIRIHESKKKLRSVMGGLGIAIVSTSRGVMTDRKARAAGEGGEVLCYVA